MAQERTEAIVLRGVDFSETSRIVTFLTPDRGRVACMAQGARSPKRGMPAMLDTFNRLEIVYYWKESRSVQKLGEVSLLDDFRGIKQDLEKSAFAAFPLEVAYKAAQENAPSEDLFATLTRGQASMARWRGDARTHAAWQAMHLLAEAGYAPTVACDGPAGGFDLGEGVVAAGQRADRRLTPRAHEALCALAGNTEACPEQVPAAEEAFTLLAAFAAHQFESEFRSLRVIQQMFA
jgi:recombinational DNA repair protein (RecF pathway)